eukprot:gnl/Hemi2/10390_TR3582_c0_g1_i1.p1 gnl/Hemi2/10390_TR3582_c0_g1~~gnl/Hemi2/10390_TR3582_c0_g1_i1.p1  ORF type:complete len:289 (+),score=54.90 gnl/Hemi2/10390_TR3582_c0_g1_i1:46-867(+)
MKAPAPALSFGLSAWQHVPGLGDQLLARASAFLTPCLRASRPHGRRFHVLATAHVTHSLRPQAYAIAAKATHTEPKADRTLARLELRTAAGALQMQSHLRARCYLLPGLDLVALHLRDEPNFLRLLGDVGFAPQPLPLARRLPLVGQPVVLFGHEVSNVGAADEAALPLQLQGKVRFRHGHTVYASTAARPSPLGMCGGPVLAEDGECAGIIFGRVCRPDEDNQTIGQKLLSDTTCFLDPTVLREFLTEVELQMDDDDEASPSFTAACAAFPD